jgi:hypothetical protein
LCLDSERWGLTHAYGSAKGIPALLRWLDSVPPLQRRSDCPEPWWSLWGALCHQSTVYTARYAATPDIAQAGTRAPLAERWQHVHLVGYIEVCRALDRDVAAGFQRPAKPKFATGFSSKYRHGKGLRSFSGA